MDLSITENNLVRQIENLKADIDAIQQPRSDFALMHFVVGAHDMPGRQRMQAVLELQIKMFNIRRAQLDERRLLAEKKKQSKIVLENPETYEGEMAQIETERIEVDLAELRLARLGAIREANCLLAILEKLPKYSYEQLQAEEGRYWVARLGRQALLDMRTTGTVSQGNIDAIQQMFNPIGTEKNLLDAGELKALATLRE